MGRIKWTKEMALKEAKQCKTRWEWQRIFPRSYSAARRNGWIDACVSHMGQPLSTPWTLERCIQDAKQYPNRAAWKYGNESAWRASRQNGWADQCCAHMKRPKPPIIKWTKESVFKDALNYNSRVEWQHKSCSAYRVAWENEWLDECCSHMTILWELKWTIDLIRQDALKYKSRSEWEMGNRFAYNAALRHKCMEEVSGHMKQPGSIVEKDLFTIIKSIYPSTQKAHFGRLIRGQHGKRFEMDIYIPELHKGIEYNGDYWHSIAGLKRSRQNWPEEDIVKYHEIKRNFFKKLDINYIEINEKDWESNPNKELHKCLKFLSADIKDLK